MAETLGRGQPLRPAAVELEAPRFATTRLIGRGVSDQTLTIETWLASFSFAFILVFGTTALLSKC